MAATNLLQYFECYFQTKKNFSFLQLMIQILTIFQLALFLAFEQKIFPITIFYC